MSKKINNLEASGLNRTLTGVPEVQLTQKQAAFVSLCVDAELAGEKINGTQLALKAGYSTGAAQREASRMTTAPWFPLAVNARKQALIVDAELSVDRTRVLQEWQTVALGEPTSIVNVQKRCCRYCWGRDHLYQWRDEDYAQEAAQRLQDSEPPLDYAGGGGFNATRPPHPECPQCDGEGIDFVYIADTRTLTPAQRRLIKGIRQGKHGIEVEFHDQSQAWDRLANFFGLMVQRKELTGKDGGPIQTQSVNYQLSGDPAEAQRQYQQIMNGGKSE